MPSFTNVLEALETELAEFAKRSWADYKDEATADAKAFINSSKADLERWTKSLANGAINQEDFEWLLASQKDLGQLKALTQSGLTKIKLERFINGVIDTIISTVFKLIPAV